MTLYQEHLVNAHKLDFNIFALSNKIGADNVLPAMALDAIKKNGLE